MERKQHAHILRGVRNVHRKMGAILFVLFVVVSLTGLLLGWKKHSFGIILPKSHQGVSTDMSDWMPMDSLHAIACSTLHEKVDQTLSFELERIDTRPDKGMVKFVFTDHFWGIQVDATTGEILHIERRRHDFIENIHDGSILDYLFNTESEILKLIYTSIMGIALLTFSITGFWLWYGPKQMRKNRVS